ncbi:MAG: VOC family protein [Rhodospirillaceae bacterium]|nr:VOC family protein [Rhodospirillaceae bacterium]
MIKGGRKNSESRAAKGLVLAAVFGIAAGLGTHTAWLGEAWADAARVSPVRRTSIMTSDMAASLTFYRDTLGFTVEYDKIIENPDELNLVAPGAKKGRVIALRQGTKLGGSVGLSWFDNMKPRAAQACDPAPVVGATSLLVLTDNLQAVYAKLRTINVPILSAPVGYDQSRGPTDAFTVFDPNCVRVAFAQIKKEAFDQSIEK